MDHTYSNIFGTPSGGKPTVKKPRDHITSKVDWMEPREGAGKRFERAVPREMKQE